MRLGILGSMVWDRIDHPDTDTVERWGGVSYSLAAAAAAAPDDWVIRPIAKLGDDLADEAREFMASLPGIDPDRGLARTDEPNNRVHLRYLDREDRQEFLAGGVPPWRWSELERALDGIDALYVNLVSGFELDLDTAARLRAGFDGLIYADLHSLLLGVGAAGLRAARPLARRDAWLDAFDVIQVNAREFALVAGEDDPWRVARKAVGRGLRALLVTRGPRGVDVLADRPADSADPVTPRPAPGGSGVTRERASYRWSVPVEAGWTRGDPTGCGDVWGATCFVALAGGVALEPAIRAAHAAASRNVLHQGADGLFAVLKGDT